MSRAMLLPSLLAATSKSFLETSWRYSNFHFPTASLAKCFHFSSHLALNVAPSEPPQTLSPPTGHLLPTPGISSPSVPSPVRFLFLLTRLPPVHPSLPRHRGKGLGSARLPPRPSFHKLPQNNGEAPRAPLGAVPPLHPLRRHHPPLPLQAPPLRLLPPPRPPPPPVAPPRPGPRHRVFIGGHQAGGGPSGRWRGPGAAAPGAGVRGGGPRVGHPARGQAQNARGSAVAARPQGQRPHHEASGRGVLLYTTAPRHLLILLPLIIRFAHFVHHTSLILPACPDIRILVNLLFVFQIFWVCVFNCSTIHFTLTTDL